MNPKHTPNMMKRKNTSGDPDTRHLASSRPSQYRWYAPYVNSKATIDKNTPNSWIQDSGRPHLNVILDKKHKIKALVDSGSTICLADSSILNHIANKSSPGPPINVTDCHSNQRTTQGCYKAILDIEDNLPHPLRNKHINIHVTQGVSSELILGTDFLKENGAIINIRDNTVAFLDQEMERIAKCKKPILREAIAASTEINTPYSSLTDTYPDIYMVQTIEDETVGHREQIRLQVQVITEFPILLKPGTTVMITSNKIPAPYVPDGLYNIKDNNLVYITMRNTDIRPLKLRKNQPITGVTVHLMNKGDYTEIPISDKMLETCFPPENNETRVTDTTQNGNKSNTTKTGTKKLQSPPGPHQATSSLEETGFDPPGTRSIPSQEPSPKISKNLIEQFDTKDIDQAWIPAYKQMIIDNYDVFSLNEFDRGHTPHYQHRIEQTTNQPTYVQQFKIPIDDEKSLDEFATDLTAAHVLIEQPSAHNTPIFMVAKRDGTNTGKKQFIQDFRKRNAVSQNDKYIIRDVRESLTAMGKLKPKIFSKCDFTGAFYAIPLEKSSQPLTSFTLPFRSAQFSWTRLPQGLKGASASFSKLCQIIFRDIQNVVTYVDDLMASATTHQEMIQTLNRIFEECRYHGIKLNLKKCVFGVIELTWLGYSLNEFGISPEYDKAEAIKTMVPPRTIKEVKSHLGLFQFFSELIKDYTLISEPLGAITGPDNHWRGEKLSGPLPTEAVDAWKKIIKIISSRPAISFPDFSLPFQLHVDASVGQEHITPPIKGGIGAILTQIQEGVTRPIGYYSRQFRDSECKYNAYNAELTGIVAALEHFYHYLKGSRTTVITDHLPIVKNGKRDNNTMDALRIEMNKLDMEILHIRGDTMPADSLSRQAKQETKLAEIASALDAETTPTMSEQQWKWEQKRDTTCREIRAFIEDKRLSLTPEVQNIIDLYGHKATIDQPSGLLYVFTAKNRHISSKRLWVPEAIKDMIVTNHHGSSLTGHTGETNTYERIATKYFWPSMAQDISKSVRDCKQCHQQKDTKLSTNKSPLKTWKTPTHRNMRIHVNLTGPLTPSRGFTHIVTITDAFTHHTELVAIPNTCPITIAKSLLDNWILRHGFYQQVVSDHGDKFLSDIMDELNKILKIRHHVIGPYNPHINGGIERIHKTMGDYLQTYCENASEEWTDFIPSLRFALNTRINGTTKMSPYFMTYMEHTVFPWAKDQHLSYSESDIMSRIRLLNCARELISSNSEEAKAASKRVYDTKTKEKRYKPGDSVLLHYSKPIKSDNTKPHLPWRGIYTIIEKDTNHTYKLKKKGGRTKIAHISQMKYYDPENSQSDENTQISHEDDLDAEIQTIPTGRTTRSSTDTLPPPIDRYSSANIQGHNTAITNSKQPLTDTPTSRKYDDTTKSNIRFANEFRKLFQS